MKIDLRKILVRDLTSGYADSGATGVVGFKGRLDIRPPYQREFVYKDEQRNKVIETVRKGYPLNVMYWVRNPDQAEPENEDLAKFEVLDGQQRTLSICQYVQGDYSIQDMYFCNLPDDQKDQILDYELTVYVCEGSDSEKLEWFRTINIAGEKLSEQELRNAVYTGPWLANAKAYFSKPNCGAYHLGSNYITGVLNRQEYLETALSWISGGEIEQYMACHQHDGTAVVLWNYFSSVINWVKAVFPNYRREMKSVNWGALYNAYKDAPLDPVVLERRIRDLMQDEDVTKKSGIYAYLLTGEEKHLSIRAFTDAMKREAYERQKGLCPKCGAGKTYKIEEMEADHIDPWHAGGKTIAENCKMLCKHHNRTKGGV